MNDLTTNISNANIAITLAALGLFLWYFIHNMRHTKNKKATLFLEVMRLLLVSVVLITMFQPELVKSEQNEQKPQLKILYDNSGSMGTEDVLENNGKILTRKEKVKAILGEGFQKKLQERFDVTIDSFSSKANDNKATNISEALKKNLESSQNLRSVILISDGSWNEGEHPVDTAMLYRSKQVPIYTVNVGSDKYLPDLLFEKTDVPTFGLVNEKILIPFTLKNYLNQDVVVNVTLESDRLVRVEKSVRISAGGRISDSLIWQPKFEGNYNFKLSVPEYKNEIDTKNNSRSFSINVRQEQLKVLVVDSVPRWEYRYLRNALMRDPGVTVHTLLLHQTGMKRGSGNGYLKKFPESREALSSYDVVFLGDVGVGNGQLSKEQATMIRALVEKQGSGVVFMPGYYGNHLSMDKSDLKDLIPVIYDEKFPGGRAFNAESKLVLTSHGRDHLLTLLSDTPAGNANLWKQLPGFYWNAAVLKAKIGANVLAVHSSLRTRNGGLRMPLLVTRSFGNGSSLFLGTDSAWRWRRGVEDKYHYRFWGQVVRWMSNKRHMAYSKQVRLFYNPTRIIKGDKVDLQATVLDKAGFPRSKDIIHCRISGPDKIETQFQLKEDEGGWGLYKGSFEAQKGGKYTIFIKSADKSISFQKSIVVEEETLEKIGQPITQDTLKDIARLSRARNYDISKFAFVVQEISELPEPEAKEIRFRIWNQWWWGGIIILLAGIYWVSRKRLGLV